MATIAAQPVSAEVSGSATQTAIGPGRSRHDSSGHTARVPRRATGTTGTPFSTATWNAPRRNGITPAARTNVPSGKMNSESPSSIVAASAPAESRTPRCTST